MTNALPEAAASPVPCFAAVQMNSGDDVAANLAQMELHVRAAAAAGACLVVLPENFALMAATQEAQTIGSTVAALVAKGHLGVCAWAGDSRVYRCRDGSIEQVTQDHALVEELVERGVLTRDQAVGHPQGNLVTRAVGAADQLCLDLEVIELRDGDTFILCSDGLDKEVTPEEIAEVVARENDRAVSEVLVDIALSRGCRDNITVIAVDIHGQDPQQESEDTIPRFGAAESSAGS